jgi:hypothetical protein
MEDDVLWIELNLKVQFYQPEKLEAGMWFMNSLYPGTDREFLELWELTEDVPDEQLDDFIFKNGFPVEIFITQEAENPDEPDHIIVYPENIGWCFDINTESMDIIDIKFINTVIQDYGGNIFLLINGFIYDDLDEIVPEMENELVILSYPFEEEEEEEEFEN